MYRSDLEQAIGRAIARRSYAEACERLEALLRDSPASDWPTIERAIADLRRLADPHDGATR